MRAALAVAVIVAAMAPAPAGAFQTGNSLHGDCLDQPAGPTGACVAYLAGVIDGMWWGKPNTICFPDGVTQGQAAAVIVKYMRENPERMHLSAPVLVADALMPAFPCPN